MPEEIPTQTIQEVNVYAFNPPNLWNVYYYDEESQWVPSLAPPWIEINKDPKVETLAISTDMITNILGIVLHVCERPPLYYMRFYYDKVARIEL